MNCIFALILGCCHHPNWLGSYFSEGWPWPTNQINLGHDSWQFTGKMHQDVVERVQKVIWAPPCCHVLMSSLVRVVTAKDVIFKIVVSTLCLSRTYHNIPEFRCNSIRSVFNCSIAHFPLEIKAQELVKTRGWCRSTHDVWWKGIRMQNPRESSCVLGGDRKCSPEVGWLITIYWWCFGGSFIIGFTTLVI